MMSMKRLAILTAAGQGTVTGTSVTASPDHMTTSSGATSAGRSPGGGSLHGNVNVLLGGAMLSGVIIVVFLVCYCCHRNMRKNGPPYPRSYWRDPEVPMEIFAVAPSAQCYERGGGLFMAETHVVEPIRAPSPGPPPAYDAVVRPENKTVYNVEEEKSSEKTIVNIPSDETGLPSYEAALRIAAGGYV